MPLVIFLIVAIGGMTTAITIASHEKQELKKHQRTWKGEMLMPPEATPTPTVKSK